MARAHVGREINQEMNLVRQEHQLEKIEQNEIRQQERILNQAGHLLQKEKHQQEKHDGAMPLKKGEKEAEHMRRLDSRLAQLSEQVHKQQEKEKEIDGKVKQINADARAAEGAWTA